MSKVTNQIDNIIRSAGWAKSFAALSNVMKYKKVTGIQWMTEEYLADADNEQLLLYMIASGKAYPKAAGGDEPERPAPVKNTPEQDAIQEDVIAKVKAGETNITVDGVANNITIPSAAAKAVTLTGAFQDGATVTNLSKKYLTVVNTGDAASVTIDSPDYASVTLQGAYKDIYANVRSVGALKATAESVTFDSALEGKGSLLVNADWKDNVKVVSYNTNDLIISNASDDSVMESLSITAPNATVQLNGKWGNVTSSTGNDTLKLFYTTHVDKLTVEKGNVIIYSAAPENVVGEVVLAPGCTCTGYEYHIPADGTALCGNAGIYYLDKDLSGQVNIGFSKNGTFKYVNSGKFSSDNEDAALMLFSAADVTLEGGEWLNTVGYGVWAANEGCKIRINSGKFTGSAHAVYAEKGFIDIYGGEFSVLDGEDAKYLINCYDANYTAGKAGITVYGGKFHGFDPAASNAEPGAPVSLVAKGYKSVRTGETTWEVFPEGTDVTEWTVPAEPDAAEPDASEEKEN